MFHLVVVYIPTRQQPFYTIGRVDVPPKEGDGKALVVRKFPPLVG